MLKVAHKQGLENKQNHTKKPVEVIAIGASTGGTHATMTLLKSLPKDLPPIVVVQHMPKSFTGLYAHQLDQQCDLHVFEAKNGMVLEAGHVYIAPGDHHLTIEKRAHQYRIVLSQGDRVKGHKPSVDVLFHSLANLPMQKSVGLILSGMGSDGAEGLLAMKNAHAHTLGQSESSCVVYGMPKTAMGVGAIVEEHTIEKMGSRLVQLVRGEK